jgi:alpha-D-xyloside xylohydrolase
VTLHVFELDDGAAALAHVPTQSSAAGATFEVRREGPLVHVQARNTAKPWRVLLRGINTIQSATGAVAANDTLGALLTPEPGANSLSVRLAS